MLTYRTKVREVSLVAKRLSWTKTKETRFSFFKKPEGNTSDAKNIKWIGVYLIQTFLESLILAQDERWRRA
jgi:hypothetical protein